MEGKVKAKPRLGRGLSSLVSVSEPVVEIEVAVPVGAPMVSIAPPQAVRDGAVDVPVADVVPNPHQPRRVFSEASIAELAASIKTTGLIQPIVVKRTGAGYELIAGERRLRAAKLAGLTTIPALLRDVDSMTQAQMALIENIQREDLNPIDRALGYRTLIDQLGLTQAELAGRLGEDRSSIANFLRLLDLVESVREMVRDGRLALGHAKLLAGVADPLEQQRLANLIVSQGLSVRNVERLLAGAPPAPPRQQIPGSAHLQEVEKSIARQLGLKVQVKSNAKGKGRLVLHYGNLDQFDQLMERMRIKID